MPDRRPNCSQNSHRKFRRNVPRIFDVCSELKSDCKSYFGFLVEKFSEAVNTEITMFLIISWSDFRSWSQVRKKMPTVFPSPFKKKNAWSQVIKIKLRFPLLQIQNNLNNLFVFFTSNTPNTFQLDFLWAFSEQFWLPGIYLIDTVTGSRIKGKLLVRTSLEKSSTTNPQ